MSVTADFSFVMLSRGNIYSQSDASGNYLPNIQRGNSGKKRKKKKPRYNRNLDIGSLN